MYVDKLAGRVSGEGFDQKSVEWCQEQAAVSLLSQPISRPTEISAMMFWADRLVQGRARLSFLQNV